MSYIDDSLVPDEDILYEARISLWGFVKPVLILGLVWVVLAQIHRAFNLLMMLLSLYIIVRIAISITTTEFALTNKRIIAKTGFLRRNSIEIMLSKLESITVHQSLDGRIFSFGTVVVVGSGGTSQAFKMIDKPMELRKRVNSQISFVD